MDKIRVLIIDDAAFMVKALTELLTTDDQIEVIGSARNGVEGLEKIKELRPDVVTLDVDMPVMDGIYTVRHIMIESPVPVVMLSSLFEHGDITFEALRLGVVDFLPKPSGAVSRDIHDVKGQIVERVKLAASQLTGNVRRVKLVKWDDDVKLRDQYSYHALEGVVAVGTTLGGPNTVINLMSKLHANLPVAVVIIQELAPGILPGFIEKFDQCTPWKVELAEEGKVLEQGACYIASYSEPYEIVMGEESGVYLKRMPESEDRPLDKLFTTASDVFAEHAFGMLLTGVGDDGYHGFEKIKAHFGITFAQNVDTCVYPNLTECAIEHGVVDYVVDGDDMAEYLNKKITEKHS